MGIKLGIFKTKFVMFFYYAEIKKLINFIYDDVILYMIYVNGL